MAQDFNTPFEKDNNYSSSYFECTEYYKMLSDNHPEISMQEAGQSDVGKPIYEIVISTKENSDDEKMVLFVNNAIHPGEPCGVDASMMLARDLVTDSKMKSLLDHIVVVIIPYYNVGGGLNRGSYSRANQQGPKEYGFRGNAKNLDLNRDFIKCDSKNAVTFNQLFNKWTPEVFIDNHTSNGADYQYVMTLIATQKDKLGPNMSEELTKNMLPSLYDTMAKGQYEMTPYVYASSTPDHGIKGFLDAPRYSTGYAALHHAIGFMPETHMLKPFKDRVYSTYEFMKTCLTYCSQNYKSIISAYEKDIQHYATLKDFPIHWKLDETKTETIKFKGYESQTKPSDITGKDRLYYDQSKPYEKEIPFQNNYEVSTQVVKPKLYIVPQAYDKVIDRLLWNGVQVQRLNKDTLIKAKRYYIEDYGTVRSPYEGHYLHYDVVLRDTEEKVLWREGDYIIETGQGTDRYIVETLEPHAPDSYFSWNFFDGILMQKEHFSSYVFEDLAKELLDSNPGLSKEFEEKKNSDEAFRDDERAQLNFIYKNSRYYEKTFSLYPVGRVF